MPVDADKTETRMPKTEPNLKLETRTIVEVSSVF